MFINGLSVGAPKRGLDGLLALRVNACLRVDRGTNIDKKRPRAESGHDLRRRNEYEAGAEYRVTGVRLPRHLDKR
jgi:hypothetical protein